MNEKTSQEVLSYCSLYTQEEHVFKLIRPLFQKIHSFAINMIFKELLKLRSAVTPVTYCACLCSVRLQYDLPCKHILSINGNQIPLDTIASRWRFDSIKNDNGKFNLIVYTKLRSFIQWSKN